MVLSNNRSLKIILVNHRYFISGGPERYMFNIKEGLESQGHMVVPFTIKHCLNKASEFESFFLDKIGSGKEVYYDEHKSLRIKDIFQLFGGLFYSFKAKRKFSVLIKEIKPDIIYIIYLGNKISFSIIDAAKKHKVPVVYRISDFGLICAANVFYLYKSHMICEKCLNNNKFHLVLNKCYHNSTSLSLLKYLSYLLFALLKIEKKIDAFVIPATFTIKKHVLYGIQESKIFHIPTFFNFTKEMLPVKYNDFARYIGRIDPDKGIAALIDAFLGTDYELKIIGFSMSGYEMSIKESIAGKNHKISFLGRMEFPEMEKYLRECCFTILPSACYDNFPNAILESYAFKKPVIATDIGSFREIVANEETGLLFRYNDHMDLRNKVERLFSDRKKTTLMGENGFKMLKDNFSKEKHLEKLISLFKSLA